MSRITRILSVVFFAAIMYLILAGSGNALDQASHARKHWICAVLCPLFRIPLLGRGRTETHGDFLCGLRDRYLRDGRNREVRTGLVFGAYHYSDMLGIKLGHVPVLIPLGWFMMIYPSRVVAKAILPYERCALDSGNHRSGRIVGDGDDSMGSGHGPSHCQRLRATGYGRRRSLFWCAGAQLSRMAADDFSGLLSGWIALADG